MGRSKYPHGHLESRRRATNIGSPSCVRASTMAAKRISIFAAFVVTLCCYGDLHAMNPALAAAAAAAEQTQAARRRTQLSKRRKNNTQRPPAVLPAADARHGGDAAAAAGVRVRDAVHGEEHALPALLRVLGLGPVAEPMADRRALLRLGHRVAVCHWRRRVERRRPGLPAKPAPVGHGGRRVLERLLDGPPKTSPRGIPQGQCG